jgi:uncharacterized protein
MNRLFLDANVLFTAAHNPHGKAAFLIQAAAGHWRLATSGYALAEARRNLERKFPDRVSNLEALLAGVELVPFVSGEACPLPLRDKDKPIYQAALAGGATHLITGDHRDFGPYMNAPETTGGLVVQTVADYLRAILAAPSPGTPP